MKSQGGKAEIIVERAGVEAAVGEVQGEKVLGEEGGGEKGEKEKEEMLQGRGVFVTAKTRRRKGAKKGVRVWKGLRFCSLSRIAGSGQVSGLC